MAILRLVLFGENITPNLHKLAKEFVLLDNFYCDGEVSADGHSWSMGAYATDYLEKIWPTSYGGRGGGYYGEGMNKQQITNGISGINVRKKIFPIEPMASSLMQELPVFLFLKIIFVHTMPDGTWM